MAIIGPKDRVIVNIFTALFTLLFENGDKYTVIQNAARLMNML